MTERAYERLVEAQQDAEREAALEAEATALLKANGAFRRGTGIQGPRRAGKAARCTGAWAGWEEDEIPAIGSVELWEEMDAVAEAARLTPDEKAVLDLARREDRSLREVARALGFTVYKVRRDLKRALRKCARRRDDHPCSARALFWEEIRQKQASIYRKRR